MNRVAITGMGIVSCLGSDRETVAQRLYQGRSVVQVDPERVALGFRSPLVTRVAGLYPSRYLNRKSRKTMTDFAIQAYAAALDAIEEAGLAPEDIGNEQTGLIFGCDSNCLAASRPSQSSQATQDDERHRKWPRLLLDDLEYHDESGHPLQD